jgi:hypothetical protein
MEHEQHMSRGQTEVCPPPAQSPAAQLRKIGLIVLLAGFAIAGMIYLFVPDRPSPEDDPLLTDYYDRQQEAIERVWGTEGSLMLELTRSLKHPSTYSAIVIVVSVLGSFVCFHLARDSYDGNDEPQAKSAPQP